jgi:endonuclease/exonuclease/phosphatase family metal-dependent hydrolase
MKHIKPYKIFESTSPNFPTTRDEVVEVCEKNVIENYTINDDISNDVDNVMTKDKVVKVMTYNIRYGAGMDGKLDLGRIAGVINRTGVQIIGLNEVDNQMFRSNYKKQYQVLARELKMNYVFGVTLKGIIGSYGNAILTTFPVESLENHSLPIAFGHEPRGVLEARVILPDQTKLRILTTHLSVNKRERIRQVKWLNNYLENIDKEPFILMGDFNENINNINFSQSLNLATSTAQTYPADNPSKSIDIIFSNYSLDRGKSIDLKASDHLPLVVEMNYS